MNLTILFSATVRNDVVQIVNLSKNVAPDDRITESSKVYDDEIDPIAFFSVSVIVDDNNDTGNYDEEKT